MIISLPIDIYLSSTDVTDSTPYFDPTIHRNFAPGDRLQFEDSIWENTGDLLIVPTWDPNTEYQLGDIVFKDNVLQKATSEGNELVPKQPEDYSSVDTNLDASTWSNRYVKITDPYQTSFDFTVGNYRHSILVIEEDAIVTENCYYNNEPAQPLWGTGGPIVNPSNFVLEEVARVYTNEYYFFKTYIINGTALYARTNVDAPMEYDSVATGVIFTPINNIRDLEIFTRIKPNLIMAPFDYKHYTKANKMNSMEYIINCPKKFDTLALGKVTGTTINVYFYDDMDATGNIVYAITNMPINTSRDNNNILDPFNTTHIVYANQHIDYGSIKFVISHNGLIELGSIYIGSSVPAGFTNLQFTNGFIDHSPQEIDAWGNVNYIDGIRVRTFEGTVDVLVTDYDTIDRLMLSIGGNTVIMNGSDSTDNAPPDNQTIFGATMLIGRMSNYKLQTKPKDLQIGEVATYSFKLTELT